MREAAANGGTNVCGARKRRPPLAVRLTDRLSLNLPLLEIDKRKEHLASLSPEEQQIQKANWAEMDREANLNHALPFL